jgi:formylglycine-generating enzyme required for sulfatase activity
VSPERAPARSGKIVTFYSYKGGTGRSMALANVAWLLASAGQRVLTIDWDLEAPGLHRYFDPFLDDKSLQQSTGVIDFMLEFATAAVSGRNNPDDRHWYERYSNILSHTISIDWEFPDGGLLDFVPAGRQDGAYATRVNSFNWETFYEKLGGGILLEAVKEKLRPLYDFILIDSRTGVSDTSGVCTVQMPDELVVCFTLNRQSVYGAAAAARSAHQQRTIAAGPSTLKIWPVPTRVESHEKDRLEIAETVARTVFTGLASHLDPLAFDTYWGEIGIPYEPYYAYEEVLAIFKDRPRQANSMLSKMEQIARYLHGDASPLRIRAMDDAARQKGLAAFTSRSAWQSVEELELLALEYENIRRQMPPSADRTEQMSLLVGRAQILGGKRDAGRVAEELFARATDGSRVVALALARQETQRRHLDMALEAISHRRSPFEQFHALMLTERLLDSVDVTAKQKVRAAIEAEMERTITLTDQSRWRPASAMLKALQASSSGGVWTRPTETSSLRFAKHSLEVEIMECRPSASFVKYEDVDEHHGDWVVTRGTHQFQVPPVFGMAKYLVTNTLYMLFVDAGGYEDDALWTVSSASRSKFVTGDGRSLGPASWPSAAAFPDDRAHHPVCGVSYAEARAFVAWCNREAGGANARTIDLPSEDLWELGARGESGLVYPWGDAFDATKCNCAEQNLKTTTRVDQHASGASPFGCCDMAGNVWEFVEAADMGGDRCVMRGGSFLNTRFEVRSYLRLTGVPRWHRAPDFGFRIMLANGPRSTPAPLDGSATGMKK